MPRRRRLLVIEDAAERLSITALLENDDIEIVTAGTGAEGLDRLNEERFDCVVLDLSLPDMSGFDVLRAVGDDATLSDLPVIVFTGRELSAEERQSCTPWPAASWSRAVAERLLDEAVRIAWSAICPPRSRR